MLESNLAEMCSFVYVIGQQSVLLDDFASQQKVSQTVLHCCDVDTPAAPTNWVRTNKLAGCY